MAGKSRLLVLSAERRNDEDNESAFGNLRSGTGGDIFAGGRENIV